MLDRFAESDSEGRYFGGSDGAGWLRRAERTFLLIALGALLGSSWQRWARRHRHRLSARPAAMPHKLQTWEGEGGRPDPEPESTPGG